MTFLSPALPIAPPRARPVPQICVPDQGSGERWDSVVVAREAEGPHEEVTTWEHKGSSVWPVPRITCGRLAVSPRIAADLS